MTVYDLPRDRSKEEAEGRGWKKKARRGREQEVKEIWGWFREIKQQAQRRTVPDFRNNRGKTGKVGKKQDLAGQRGR